MKKAHEIIYNLTHDSPTFEPLRQKMQISRFILLLPYSLRQAILFTYVKHRTLLFALNHPAFLKEFNYRIPLIKSLLIKAQAQGFHELANLNEVKVFVSNRALKREIKQEQLHYEEHSSENFKNHAKDPKLHALFEEIRSIIKRNNLINSTDDEEGFWKRQLL